MKWVKKKSGPPAETIRRMAEYQEIKKQTVYLIAFFDEFEVRPVSSTCLSGPCSLVCTISTPRS